MKQTSLFALSLSTLLWTAACAHKTPVAAARPPAVTADAPPAPPTQPLQQRATPAPAAQATAEPRRPATITPQDRKRLEDSLARLADALFDYDKSVIRTDATDALKSDVAVITEILSNYPSQKLLIEGHCDERGSAEYNLALGDRRARAAQEFLISMGVPDRQFTLVSYGKDRPVCTDQSEACWQKNRRAHLTAAP